MPLHKWQDDQAAGLRRMARSKPVHVIAISSGKGGVGKTNVSVNLAITLAMSGKEVMLMDADLGLANVDMLLGIQSKYNLFHVLTGERTLSEIVISGPSGVQIVPAASGIKKMSELTEAENVGIVRAFEELSHDLDFLLIDTAAGISDNVIRFCCSAQEVVVVLCDEPASITDAYALIKILSRDYGLGHFNILANMVYSYQQGRILFEKLLRVTDRFLDVTLRYLDPVLYDKNLRKAVQQLQPVVVAYPRSTSSLAFNKLAKTISRWPIPENSGGRIEFFMERLLRYQSASTPASGA